MTEKNREEKLQEDMFDMMLRYAAEQAGEELLDEQEDGEPVAFSQRHQKEMEKLFKQMAERRPPIFYISRIAAVLILLVVLTGTTMMGVDAWRAKIFNFFTKPSQTNTEIRYEENLQGNTYIFEMVKLNYVPEGMKFERRVLRSNEEILHFVNEEQFFKLRVARVGSVSYIDTEDKETEKVFINGVEAYLRTANEECVIKWYTEKKAYILSGNLDKETLLKIAEKIQ